MYLENLLGLVFGEMVTNLLIIPGDCCIGGVRHILSSFSVLGVISSPTRILSRLPSSTPLPNHRPHGNLHSRRLSLTSPSLCDQHDIVRVMLTCKCVLWSRCGPKRTPPATLRKALCYRDPSGLWSACPGFGTGAERERERARETLIQSLDEGRPPAGLFKSM